MIQWQVLKKEGENVGRKGVMMMCDLVIPKLLLDNKTTTILLINSVLWVSCWLPTL